MLHAVVEGEPGIFPDPVARLLRGITGLFRKDEDRTDEPAPRPESDEAPSPDWEPPRPPDTPDAPGA